MMERALWWVSLTVLVLSFLLGLFFSARPRRRRRFLTLTKCVTAGIFLSGLTLLFPLYYLDGLEGSIFRGDLGRSLLTAFQHTMRLFVLDGGYAGTMEQMAGWDAAMRLRYENLCAVLYALAPLTTFGFILTFVKNISSHLRYWLCRLTFWRGAHVFSELNERSLALAESILENRTTHLRSPLLRLTLGWAIHLWDWVRRPVIVFAGVSAKWEEETLDLAEQAREMGAILFRKDLSAVSHGRLPLCRLTFYLIGDDEGEKLNRAADVLARNYRNSRMYLFSGGVSANCFLKSFTQEEKEKIRTEVIRVDDRRALIYHQLDENGLRLFRDAYPREGERVISAVIVGLGRYGEEMLRALLWYTQVPGYRVELTAIDRDPEAASRFEAACPELILGPHGHVPGDMAYHLAIHRAEVGTEAFDRCLRALPHPTYVFVSLGSDEANVAAALHIRRLYAAADRTPHLDTVIYDSALKARISREGDNEMSAYGLHAVGDVTSFYTEGVVIDSQLTREAYALHSRWESCVGVHAKNNFYMNDYNYYSSLTRALHARLLRRMPEAIPGLDKAPEARTEAQRLAIGEAEHIRWNAYMRTEGYVRGKTKDHVKGHHPDLVPTSLLSPEDLKKDQ